MIAPLAVRDVVAAGGVLLVGASAASIVGTVVVPRPVAGWLTRRVDQLVNAVFIIATKRFTSYRRRDLTLSAQAATLRLYRRRDRILSAQAATLLLCQLITWLGMFYIGFSLMLWPLVHGGITAAFRAADPLWQIGSSNISGPAQQAILDIAEITGFITITLQIAYLPTLYSAFNRRETEVALLNARAGVPSWGPELLARTHYALGTGVSTLDTLPELYESWERWAADMAESHTTYLPLVRFRSPKPLSSWVTALLAVLDSAALFMALAPKQAPEVPARLCLRAGFLCLRDIATAMGFVINERPNASQGIAVSYQDFLEAIARLREVGFEIERPPEEAWEDFVGWRVNYEQAAFAIAREVDAVPALWSGPRRHDGREPIRPIRPPK